MKTKIAGLLGIAILCMSFSFGGFIVGTSTLIARAAACGVPYTFVNGTPADANQVNANFAAIVACFSTIDNTNIGPAGIYASQIIPTNTSQASFGGSQQYTFPNGLIPKTGGAGLTTSATDDCGLSDAAAGFEFFFSGCLMAGDKIGNVGIGQSLFFGNALFQEGTTANVLPGGIEFNGLGGNVLEADGSNNIVYQGAIEAVNTTSTNFGPVPPCFTQNGTRCTPGTEHIAHGSLTTTTTTSSCTALTLCSLASSGAVVFTAPAAFTSQTSYSCTGVETDEGMLPIIVPSSGGGFLSDVFNTSNTTISSGTAIKMQWTCEGS